MTGDVPQDRSRPAGVEIIDHGTVREIRLNRPAVHNAFDAPLVRELDEAFTQVARETESPAPTALRAVLLSSAGKSFCAGADLNYMKEIAGFGETENRADALALSRMFLRIRTCPIYVVARVQGATLGGGTGLIAACDRVIASDAAVFGFTEVRLGIVPAVISPFVVERIGTVHARALFATGERFDAQKAQRIGLVDEVVLPSELEATLQSIIDALHLAAPGAAREARGLVERVGAHPIAGLDAGAPLFRETAQLIARLRAGAEGQEGMAAFLEKRPPAWSSTGPDVRRNGSRTA